MRKPTVKLGTKFRSYYADGNPQWEVIQSRGQGVWICEVVEGPDWLGTTKPFTTEEIQAAVHSDNWVKQAMDDHRKFYAGLKEGQIVHHIHNRDAYVRCRVSRDHKLLPFALVGNWAPFELPKRQADGSIYYGYHCQQIIDEKLYQPNCSQIWEFNHHGQPDPTNLPEIKFLELVPPMTVAQQLKADLHQTIDKIQAIINEHAEDDPGGALLMISNILEKDSL